MRHLLPESFTCDDVLDYPVTPGFVSSAALLSRQLTWLFWADSLHLCEERIDDATKFIGPHDPYEISGATHVVNALQMLRDDFAAHLTLHNERYEVISLGTASCVILAHYRVEETERAATLRQQGTSLPFICSFVWTQSQNGDPRLMLWQWASSSTPVAATKGDPNSDRIRGNAVSIGTIGSTGNAARQQVALQAHGSDGVTYWIQPESIIYVSAAHQYTDVYCTDRHLRLRASFSSVIDQLGSVVVCVHRSYAVNPAYVIHFERSSLYLTNGTKIPIPVRRARETRLMLQEHFNKLGKRD